VGALLEEALAVAHGDVDLALAAGNVRYPHFDRGGGCGQRQQQGAGKQ